LPSSPWTASASGASSFSRSESDATMRALSGSRLGRGDALDEDGVEHLRRRHRARERLGGALESLRVRLRAPLPVAQPADAEAREEEDRRRDEVLGPG
jgi:hypothetical protein